MTTDAPKVARIRCEACKTTIVASRGRGGGDRACHSCESVDGCAIAGVVEATLLALEWADGQHGDGPMGCESAEQLRTAIDNIGSTMERER